MEILNINDNISLYSIPMKKLKTSSLGVYIHRPLCEEEASANAVLPYVMKRGFGLCPNAKAVSDYLENLYGASLGAGVLKRGDDHIIYFSAETISDKYAPQGECLVADTAELMMSLLFEPRAFDEENVEREKKNAVDRITAEINDKRQYAQLRCCEEMCKDESFALSRLGTKDGVDALNAEILKKRYEEIITSSPIYIYVCGDADINAVAQRIRAYASKLTFKPASMPKEKIFERHGDVRRVTENMDVVQGKLCMGFRTGTPSDDGDYIPLTVMNSIFGGGAHSKLFNNVREKLSLCYYASSSIVRSKGLMFVNAGIEFSNFDKAYNEILVQLDAVKNGDISEFEFESSVNALINQLESYNDDQNAMQIFCMGEKISGTNYSIDDMKEMIRRVTIEDVKRAAAKTELDTVYFLAGKEEK